ncbi:hypothetical protein [Paraferrimonas sedimenticola]|uniref:Uncharacterized protein n=1 Tax=Paraferrimonas sedimenticola TaxID=375674 RepID=A0AA37W1V0_9GAMM|nr:hypothetical protein [Paraferrimonas sedimenticola]GLP96852.1 hypothetical protein GCM10007895_21580 [Paraferrimonas sedimenticola]
MKCRAFTPAFIVFGALATVPAQADEAAIEPESRWSPDIRLSLGRNDNIGNAELKRDIVDDNFATLSAGLSYRWPITPLQTLSIRGFAEAQRVEAVKDLSRYSGGAEISYRFRFNPMPTSWSITANLFAQVDDYQTHRQRDGQMYTGQLIADKPISDVWSASVGLEYRHRDAHSDVWDLRRTRGFVSSRYEFVPTWSISGTYSYIDGDVASTTRAIFPDGTPADDIFKLVQAADAIEIDQAFTAAFDGIWIGYRLPAKTHTLKLGVDKRFANKLVLDLSAMRVIANARGGNKYRNWIFGLSLQKRF